MTRYRLLVVNGCGSLEGDFNGLLSAVKGFDPIDFELHVISIPNDLVLGEFAFRDDIIVTTMSMGGEESQVTKVGPKLWRGLIEGKESISAIVRIQRYIRRNHIDAVYIVDRTMAAYVAAAAARLARRPLIINCAAWWFPQSNKLAAMVHRSSSGVHVCSEYVAQLVRPYSKSDSRVTTIQFGLDIARYVPGRGRDEARSLLGLRSDQPLVLLPGRFVFYKGHEEVVRAAQQVVEKHPDAVFAFVGNDSTHTGREGRDSYKAVVQELIDELGLRANVRILPHWPWHKFPDLLAAADIVTMPSWEEPFGLVAAEAMAMARPVVATNGGGVPEFVLHNLAGILVPLRSPNALADAYESLIDDIALRETMGKFGRSYAEQNLTSERYAKQVRTFLIDAIVADPFGRCGSHCG